MRSPNDPTLFTEDSRAKTFPWQAVVKVWLENDRDSGGSSTAFLASCVLSGSSSKTLPDSCHQTEDGTWVPSSGRWETSAMGGPTECWTLATSESPNDAVECSLSDILEADVLPKFFLSPRACEGILRRAGRRGKKLPELLEAALVAAVGRQTPTE